MQLNLIQCDACQSQSECRDGWSKFTASITGETPIDADLCPGCTSTAKAGLTALLRGRPLPAPHESIETIEERHILAVLTSADWNKSQAAHILGIERSTLDRKLKKYRVTRPVKSEV
jgi:transcriptional regulator of acetoin/glycerol metabolism